MEDEKEKSYEEFPKSFSNIFNAYIQKPFKAGKKLFVHVAVNEHPIKTLF